MCENCEKLEKALKKACEVFGNSFECDDCPIGIERCRFSKKPCADDLFEYFKETQNEDL